MAEKCPVLRQLFSPNQPGPNLVPNERDFLSFFACMKRIGDAHLAAYILILKRFISAFVPKIISLLGRTQEKDKGSKTGLKSAKMDEKPLKLNTLM